MAKKTKAVVADRVENESTEGYKTTETGLPESRFSGKAQVSTAPETKSTAEIVKGNVQPSTQGTTASAAVAVKKKMTIRPSSEAELGEGRQVGGVPLGSGEAVANVAGVSIVNPAVDESKIPYSQGGYRPTTRYGKKITTDNFVINNTISEQIHPVVEESKDLKEAPDALQGYNGIKQFKTARGKKNAGYTPASFLYDRSVDFIEHNNIVHTTGQVLDNITAKADYPTEANFGDGPVAIANPMKKANYLLKSFKFDIFDGHIVNPRFEEECYISNGQGAVVEQANQNWQVDGNNVANTIVKLQTELGRETTEKWSPLGYVINQPYEYNMLMHDIEATTGALMAAAYRSAAHSLAFQINKLGKDGAKGVTPVYEMMAGTYGGALDSNIFESLGGNLANNVFNNDVLAKGSPAGIIKMFDSVAKYTTKADVFNQQRSFKFHLQSCDNNINPLYVKPEFIKALDKVSLFSTEDGQYNPMLPIHTTKDIMVINPLSLNYFLKDWTNPKVDATNPNTDSGTKNVYSYSYNDIRFVYNWGVRHSLVDGLMRWLLRHETNIVKAYATTADGVEDVEGITWPASFSPSYPSMLAFALCSASQDILWMRNVIFRDVLFAGEQSTYIWEDLHSLKEINPLYATQYTYSDYGSGLKLGAVAPDTAVRIFWPENIGYRLDTKNVNQAAYLLPWYFNENAIGTAYSGTGYFSTNTPNVMSMPSFRGGVNHFACDLIYGMSERDVRLSLDRMVDIPQCSTIINEGNDIYADNSGRKAIAKTIVGRAGLGRYNISNDTIAKLNTIKFGAVRYDKVSDGRVIALLPVDGDYTVLKEDTVLVTPRELGFIFPMPASMVKVQSTYFGDYYGSRDEHWAIDGSADVAMVCYRANGTDLDDKAVSRSAALSQSWTKVYAQRVEQIVNHNAAAISITGVAPAVGAFIDGNIGDPTLDASVVVKDGIYALGSAQLSSQFESTSFISLSSFLWTMLQRFYSPINLFEIAYEVNKTGAASDLPSAAPCIDPLESAIYFGFCGCLASDFNQDILERLNIKDELGMYYTKDEFIKSSLIFR